MVSCSSWGIFVPSFGRTPFNSRAMAARAQPIRVVVETLSVAAGNLPLLRNGPGAQSNQRGSTVLAKDPL